MSTDFTDCQLFNAGPVNSILALTALIDRLPKEESGHGAI
jgi:hypothetical protein